MAEAFKQAESFAGKIVRMRFNDGIEILARLHSAVTDMDGSKHLIYDEVQGIVLPDDRSPKTRFGGRALYSPGETLVSIEGV